jgi:hypothetical protein
MPNQGEQYSTEEAQRRVRAILRGVFAGPPTALKDIPKRNGESRRLERRATAKSPRKRRAVKKSMPDK